MQIPLVDLKSQYKKIQPEIDAAIKAVIEETAFINSRYCRDFEVEFADYCRAPNVNAPHANAPYCVGVANGTDALFITLKAMGITVGDEVITVANTFIASAEAIVAVGADVVFVDCDSDYYTLDPRQIEAKITPKTKAILAVHLYGQPAQMAEINALAEKYTLFVIEDAAQAHGAIYQGKTVGTLGHAACFSFYPGKNLGAYGDAGAIVTTDEKLAVKCRMLANHGRLEKYSHRMVGYNSRLDGLQAAILSVKLKHLPAWTDSRRRVAAYYTQHLADVAQVKIPRTLAGVEPVYHLYVIQAERRDELLAYLKKNGVGAGIHYPIPLPQQEAFASLGHKAGDFPVADDLAGKIISLPIFPEIENTQLDYIVKKIRDFYHE
ncbi:DegT/DnrJ/EryC1/StrS family aminotransferase [bacterium]|nr:DegT/DnrJ/EryC1/StrS family aminotransferase [bacterium]